MNYNSAIFLSPRSKEQLVLFSKSEILRQSFQLLYSEVITCFSYVLFVIHNILQMLQKGYKKLRPVEQENFGDLLFKYPLCLANL